MVERVSAERVLDVDGALQVAFGIGPQRFRLLASIGRRIDKRLRENFRRSSLSREETYDRSEIASGRLAHYGETPRRQAVRWSALGDPAGRRPRIVDRRRERMLGRQAVVDIDHREPRIGRQVPADRVEGHLQHQEVDRPAAGCLHQIRGS